MTRPTTLVLAALVLLTTVPLTAQVRELQGTWEGVHVGQESAGKVTVTFAGNSLHFQGVKADQRYDATFTLQEGTRPRQFRATITGSEIADAIGKVIPAVFKIENGTLSLAGLEDDAPLTLGDAEAFDRNPMFHYRLRKVETRQACLVKPAASPSPSPLEPGAVRLTARRAPVPSRGSATNARSRYSHQPKSAWSAVRARAQAEELFLERAPGERAG